MSEIEKDAFAEMMIAAIERAGDKRRITYDAEAFVLAVREQSDDQGSSNMFFLGNAYREYVEADEPRRAEIVRRWVAMSQVRDTGESFAEALVSLMPRVRDRAYYGLVPLQLRARGMGDKLKTLAHTPVGDVLAVSLTRDMPHTIEEVSPEQLTTWNVTHEHAFEVAMANLARRSEGDFEEIADGVYTSPWRDNFDASRMLLVDKMRSIPVKGVPIVIAANRDHLLVTGEDDAVGLQAIAEIAEEILQQPRPLSGCALRLESDGSWTTFLPPAEHPARMALWKLSASFWVDAYHEQKQLLDMINEATGEDVFVASYKAVIAGESGFSYAVWGKDVDTLLPDSDVIMIISSQEAEPLRVPAARARALFPRLFEAQADVYPPRWRVRTFPNDAQLAALARA